MAVSNAKMTFITSCWLCTLLILSMGIHFPKPAFFNFFNMVWEVTIYRGMLDFWRWKDAQLPRGLDWAFPALTARQQLSHIIPCMLIDVCTTFRVDWYVFPLFTSVERVSRCCPWCCCNFCVFGARCHENNGLWATKQHVLTSRVETRRIVYRKTSSGQFPKRIIVHCVCSSHPQRNLELRIF